RARGRVLNTWGMPWMFLHRLTDADARAIATYLKALPPVRNTIPDPLHYGTLETLAVKLTRPLPAVPPRVLTYTEGNFGPPGLGLVVRRIVRRPALAVIPPEQSADAVTGGIPHPDPERLSDPARRALVERGRYLYTVASCALCHGPDGAGGAKLSWRVLGTVWARNLTPDRDP